MNTDLGAALLDVRRAYRLLWAYHRRQSDLLSALDAHLHRHGLVFTGWRPYRFAAPSTRSAFFGVFSSMRTAAWARFPSRSRSER